MNRKRILFIFLIVLSMNVSAIDFWQYPEMADRHSIFLSAFPVSFSFADYFSAFPPEFHLDYMLPFGFPLSLGASYRPIVPKSATAGIRAAYHFNFDSENLDVYVLYSVDLHFTDEYTMLEFGPRVGFRQRFGRWFCISIESGFKFQSINFGIAIKFL